MLRVAGHISLLHPMLSSNKIELQHKLGSYSPVVRACTMPMYLIELASAPRISVSGLPLNPNALNS